MDFDWNGGPPCPQPLADKLRELVSRSADQAAHVARYGADVGGLAQAHAVTLDRRGRR